MIARVLQLALALSVVGCSFDQEDLDNWKRVAQGTERLTGYAADPSRPEALRHRALDNLFEMGALGAIFTAIDAVPSGERSKLLTYAVRLAQRHFKAGGSTESGRAARVLFEVLRRHKDLPQKEDAAVALLDWSLRWLGDPDPPPTEISLEDLIQASALVAPEAAREKLIAHIGTVESEPLLLQLDQILRPLRDEAVEAALAAGMLAQARRSYPKFSLELTDRMLANGNPTLLRFLVEAARDPRVANSIRQLGGVNAAQALGADGLESLYRLVASNDPSTNNLLRLNAIDHVWRYGGVQQLERLLRALPLNGWPQDGTSFKSEVDGFCDRLASASAQVRRVLVDLIADDKWITRTYAMACVIRLYPDDAPVILESLREDATPLNGWSEAGPTSIGEVVRALGEG